MLPCCRSRQLFSIFSQCDQLMHWMHALLSYLYPHRIPVKYIISMVWVRRNAMLTECVWFWWSSIFIGDWCTKKILRIVKNFLIQQYCWVMVEQGKHIIKDLSWWIAIELQHSLIERIYDSRKKKLSSFPPSLSPHPWPYPCDKSQKQSKSLKFFYNKHSLQPGAPPMSQWGDIAWCPISSQFYPENQWLMCCHICSSTTQLHRGQVKSSHIYQFECSISVKKINILSV